MGQYYIRELVRGSKERTEDIFTEYYLREFSGSDIEKIWITGYYILHLDKYDLGHGTDLLKIILELTDKFNVYIKYKDPTLGKDEDEDILGLWYDMDQEVLKRVEDEDEIQNVLSEWIYNAFKKILPNKTFTNKELNTILNIVGDIIDNDTGVLLTLEQEATIVQTISSLIYNEPFEVTSSQGPDHEELILVYPKRLKDKVPIIESLVFDLGTEYSFVDYKTFNSKDEYKSYTKTKDYEMNYTVEYCIDNSTPSKIRRWAANIIGCSPQDVVIC